MKPMTSKRITLLDEFSYHHVIEETLGLSLVFYTGPNCGSCHHLRDVLNEYLRQYDDLRVFEVDAVTSSALINEFNVFHLPSMFLYKEGQYHCEFHSEAMPIKIREAIAQAVLLEAEDEP